MRLRASIGGLLLALGACAHLPERVAIDVDGHKVELRPQGLLARLQPGRWSTSADCGADGDFRDLSRLGKRIVVAGPDHLQVTLKDGRVWSLYRCIP